MPTEDYRAPPSPDTFEDLGNKDVLTGKTEL